PAPRVSCSSHLAIALATRIVNAATATRYRLSFEAKTKSFVSAGAPLVKVVDASGDSASVLGQSPNLSDVNSWRPFTIEFTTGANTREVQVVVARQACPANPCAAFGTLWLDSFSITAVETSR